MDNRLIPLSIVGPGSPEKVCDIPHPVTLNNRPVSKALDFAYVCHKYDKDFLPQLDPA